MYNLIKIHNYTRLGCFPCFNLHFFFNNERVHFKLSRSLANVISSSLVSLVQGLKMSAVHSRAKEIILE